MPRSSTPVVSRPEYYDRNPITNIAVDSAQRSENTANTEVWSYTVPAGEKAFIGSYMLSILCEVAFATSTTTDAVIARMIFTKSGGGAVDFKNLRVMSAALVAGDYHVISGDSPQVAAAGDTMAANIQVVGTAAGAGRVFIKVINARTNFNA